MIGSILGFVAGEGIQILAKEAGKQIIPTGLSAGARVAAKIGLGGLAMLVGGAVEDHVNRTCEEARSMVEVLAGYEVVEQ